MWWWIIAALGATYLFGFLFFFWVNLRIGPVTRELALLRALVWPYWIVTGKPAGERLPMD